MPLPPSLQGRTWTIETARRLVPILVWCAQNHRTITYKELDQEIVRRGWMNYNVHAAAYGNAAGTLGDALAETEVELGLDLPPLNILVVNKTHRRPGSGCAPYFRRYTKGRRFESLSWAKQGNVIQEATQDIFRCRNWTHLLQHYECEGLLQPVLTLETDDDVIPPPINGFSGEGESEDHRLLKEYVLNHPAIVIDESTRGWIGKAEQPLPSGDRADVCFRKGDSIIAVEVKSHISNDADLSRGIYQCVKYRAVCIAWQRALLQVPDAHAVLVIQRDLPAQLAEVAARLSVEVKIVDKRRTTRKLDQANA
jgi:hypothetical protein